jgi:serine/threonine-protein kinase
MATVYLARDLVSKRDVAVKVLNPELTVTLAARRFLREIRIVASLRHPNILTLLDSGSVDGLLYYTMPVVTGPSLREQLRCHGRAAIEDSVATVGQLGSALDYAHSRGIVHRDIKPENILFHDGKPVLVDFGVAFALDSTALEHLTKSGHVLGTPVYMSPEQASGRRRVDGRSDIYSLACVLFEMLTGRPPFLGKTPRAVLTHRLQQPTPWLHLERPDVPRYMQQALEKGLAVVPEARFETAGAFSQALEPRTGSVVSNRAERENRSPVRGWNWMRRILRGGCETPLTVP